MPFAGLQQLLRPILRHLSRLPQTQQQGLRSAVGEMSGSPDVFLVALATLNLLSELASDTPILVCADDAQWLDPPTVEVLAFLARRVSLDPIIVLAAIRDGYHTALDGAVFSELHLGPLERSAAVALLTDRAPDLDASARQRVLDAAAGNPLALVELPVALREQDEVEFSQELPLTSRLERAFGTRVARLPEDTKSFLLVAALNDSESVAESLSATSRLLGRRLSLEDLTPAELAGLIVVDGARLSFRHPLIRSATRQRGEAVERMHAHAALGHELSRFPDRSVWHRAASVIGFDDEIAGELERLAQRAEGRGRRSITHAALERSAELTSDPEMRGTRLLRAIEIAFDLGHHETVTRLLPEVDRLDLQPSQTSRTMWLRESVMETHGGGTIGEFVTMATESLERGDVPLAVDAVLTASLKAHWFNAPSRTRAEIMEVAEQLPVSRLDPKLLAAFSLASPERHGNLVISRLSNVNVSTEADPETQRLLGIALITIPEYELAAKFLAAAVDGLREQGRLTLLARALGSQAYAALFRGDFELCEQAATEGQRITRETRQPRWECSCVTFLSAVCGLQGDPAQAEAMIAEAERLLGSVPSTPARQHFQLARGASNLANGRPDVAFEQIMRVFDPADAVYNPLIGTPGLVDLADAAVSIGRLDEARAAVRRVEPMATPTGSPFVQKALRHAHAVLAEDSEADQQYQSALKAQAGQSSWGQARLQLSYGAWLRSQERITEAHVVLRSARDSLDRLGIIPWAERAREELRASGETSPRRVPESRDNLSPQELQIARLAAQQLTNREIGQRLFLSHRTVGSYLYAIFPKLGISSRLELAQAIGSGEDPRDLELCSAGRGDRPAAD
jgi:DNA-binding NarL/FixJ family response regulator/uncharacterized protein